MLGLILDRKQTTRKLTQPNSPHTPYYISITLGCLHFTKFCWVGKHVNIIMKRTNSPQPEANPTQGKLGQKWHLGHFFPQQIIFRGLGLILYRKQATRNPTQPNSPQTAYFRTDWYERVEPCSDFKYRVTHYYRNTPYVFGRRGMIYLRSSERTLKPSKTNSPLGKHPNNSMPY